MTTIAYKDGIIAYDSRATRGDYILTDKADKKRETEENFYFMSGSVDEFKAFIALYESGEQPTHKLDICAFVNSKRERKLYYAACWKSDEGLFLIHETEVDCYQAIGSGTSFAFTAMDCDKTAVEAVKISMLRDPKTGGEIKDFKVWA